MVQSPGEMIREARKGSRVTPEDVLKRTRVRPNLLARIEGDLLSQLPEDPYCRTLYATVAEAVGADVSAVLAAYDAVRATRAEASVGRTVIVEPERRRAPVGIIVGILVLAAVIASIAILAQQPGGLTGGRNRVDAVATRTVPPAPVSEDRAGDAVVANPAAAELDGEETAAARALVDTSAATPPEVPPTTSTTAVAQRPREIIERPLRVSSAGAPLPPLGEPVVARRVPAATEEEVDERTTPGGIVRMLESDSLPSDDTVWRRELVVEVSALADSTWVRVAIDEDPVRSGILLKGETRVWRAQEVLRFDVGRDDGLELLLNRRPVIQPKAGGHPIHFELRRDMLTGEQTADAGRSGASKPSP